MKQLQPETKILYADWYCPPRLNFGIRRFAGKNYDQVENIVLSLELRLECRAVLGFLSTFFDSFPSFLSKISCDELLVRTTFARSPSSTGCFVEGSIVVWNSVLSVRAQQTPRTMERIRTRIIVDGRGQVLARPRITQRTSQPENFKCFEWRVIELWESVPTLSRGKFDDRSLQRWHESGSLISQVSPIIWRSRMGCWHIFTLQGRTWSFPAVER